jgi:hypothetical protein
MMLTRIALIVAIASTPLSAGIVQSFSFSDSANGTDAVNTALDPSGFSTGNVVVPFDQADGTLVSFLITWSMNFDFNFTTGDPGAGGDGNAGGVYYVNTEGYNSQGNGNSGGGPVGTFVDAPFSVDNSTSFVLPGVDPVILSAVLGSSDFALNWDAPFNIEASPVQTWAASVNGTVTIEYDYVPEPASLPLTLLGIGVLATVIRRRSHRLA